MTPGDLNLQAHKVVSWGLESADPLAPPSLQRDELREDLVQVELPNGDVLDVGWYPEGSLTGGFQVVVVRGADWEAPVAKAEAVTWVGLADAIRRVLGSSDEAIESLE